MKRFYKSATIEGFDDGFGILLDGRPVRTPGRTLIRIASKPLAQALRDEWEAQGETIDPLSMPLTQLTNTAIDRMPDVRDETVRELVRYGETDLVCYRADRPQTLADRQAAVWQPLLDWLRTRYEIGLTPVTGVLPQPQNPASLRRMEQIVGAYDDFRLTGLHMAATSAGSVVIGLAILEGEMTADEAVEAAQIDERHQIEVWGRDDEAEERLERGRRDIEVAAVFMNLVTPQAAARE